MRRGVVIMACAVLLFAVAGRASSNSSSSGGTTTDAGVKANDHGTKAVAAKGKTEVELDDFYPTTTSTPWPRGSWKE